MLQGVEVLAGRVEHAAAAPWGTDYRNALPTAGEEDGTLRLRLTGTEGRLRAKTGTIDVSKSSKIIASIGGIPGGEGYSISVSAVSTNGNSNCAGSASFDVQAGKKVAVNVPVLCHERGRTGTAVERATEALGYAKLLERATETLLASAVLAHWNCSA